MIFKSSYYKEILDKKNNVYLYSLSAPRGRILDRNGEILVDNKGVRTIIYNKLSGISEKDEINVAIKLASVLDVREGNDKELRYFYYTNNKNKINELIDDRIYNMYKERKITSEELLKIKLDLISQDDINSMTDYEKKASFIYSVMNNGYNYQDKIIKSDCTFFEYGSVTEMNLLGVRTELTFERIYNYENTLKNLFGKVGMIQNEELDYYKSLGYSNNDIVGISYLEKQYEKYLRGVKAKYKINNDNTVSLVEEMKVGNDLVLNIDIKLQKDIESLLDQEILNAKKYDSARYYNGSYVIVSEPSTGAILAMVGRSFNNGKFYSNEIGVINKSYTVGSIVKGATISVGYKYGIIDINTKYTDSCVKLKNKTKKCSWKDLGTLSDINALAYSSNYYQFMIAIGLTGEKYKYNMSLSNLDYAFDTYRNMLSSYGLGTFTGIDIENETIGIKGKTISDDLLLNLSIGQYDTYTPIQLTQYINTIANSGNRIKLSLMKQINGDNGKIIIKNEGTLLNKVDLDEKYIKRIQLGLNSVSSFGTGSNYIPKKYDASSKTGTSESVMDSDLDGKADLFTVTRSFVSYMPSDNPKYSLVIVSPNIDYQNNDNGYVYPINMYLARNISKILFDN